ncbi:unnamed protein product [Periconia digitata]|uniref:G-patch domain-containing protein n=1 Tax=Periconia digitata TaxID=1303443 RepID=A0A9W4XNF7_9PLEO|nr:unnamed protein product [Periconia digitata]
MPQSDEEDDYMNMVFEDAPKAPKHETSMQRAARKRKEAESRSRQKTKAEREADAIAAREEALATALPEDNKGFKMMAKLGFKQGDSLGKSEDARKEPIKIVVKEDKGGIGLESDKKRKFQETFEEARQAAKRAKEEEGDFLEERKQQQKERSAEKDLDNAQRTAERLFDKEAEEKGTPTAEDIPLQRIDICWRGRVRRRIEKQAEKQQKRELNNSLSSRLPTLAHEDEDDDHDTKTALGHDITPFYTTLENDFGHDDPDLAEFEALSVFERLERTLVFLRDTYKYCLYCGYQYPDAAMDGCPGVTEGDHD